MKIFVDIAYLLLYCGLIYWLSDQSSLPTPMFFPHQDKLMHATAYALLAWFAWQVILHTEKPKLFCMMGSLLFCSLYGISDEWHQSFVPGRQADVWDWVADTIGAALMICVVVIMKSKRHGQTQD
ncbi:MAG: VanZ family protein [Mariprofundaceae bacterium]